VLLLFCSTDVQVSKLYAQDMVFQECAPGWAVGNAVLQQSLQGSSAKPLVEDVAVMAIDKLEGKGSLTACGMVQGYSYVSLVLDAFFDGHLTWHLYCQRLLITPLLFVVLGPYLHLSVKIVHAA
jgi:hypothetical protein